ncbi:hypothetical protein ABW21_db0209034 [Orbilia brochopaga]|nr:hypothetical protein ABW21_db0209034 [Drechslerella brochopaga]
MAATTSFTSTSTIPDETPSSRFRKLNLNTPSSRARLQAEHHFDKISPVRRPNFATQPKSTNTSALTDITDPFWSNAAPPSTAATSPGKPLSYADDVVDVKRTVLDLLEAAGFDLDSRTRSALENILQQPVNKQKAYLRARDNVRSICKKEKERNDQLAAENASLKQENAKLADHNDSLLHIKKTDDVSLNSQTAEIEKLHKEKEVIEIELADSDSRLIELEDENARLRADLNRLQEALDELN